ncbi:MAG TPA: NAD-dependent epimerase/dehydratase family protein [Acidimicrobiales bacterium]
MHTLVTGGAGFIGSALVDRLLAEGHTVDVVDNLSAGSLWNLADARAGAGRDLTFHQLDLRSPDVGDLIVRRKPEVVWHLAAHTDLGVADPVADAHVNVVGTVGVVEAVLAAGTRKLIVTSSAAVYGEMRGDGQAAESHPRRPMSPHGVGKHAVDAYLTVFAGLESVVFTSMVLGTVYGPHATAGVVASWADCLVSGRPCTVFGDGRQIRDFVYVDDVVDALARAAGRGDGMVLNVGTGAGTSLAELHALMVDRAGALLAERAAADPDQGWDLEVEAAPEDGGSWVELVVEEAAPGEVDGLSDEGGDEPRARRGPPLGLRHAAARPGEPLRVVLDPSRAATTLDWAPWTSLPEGIEAVLRARMSAQTV